MIYLFTDFGTSDLYVGQVRARLAANAPNVPVIDLLNDAPAFHIEASAHLLAALVSCQPPGVTMAVIDPGVGTARRAVAVRTAHGWFVGPDNGLLSVAAGRSGDVSVYEIVWRPPALSVSFHGRDLFAPVAARLAAREFAAEVFRPSAGLDVNLDVDDLSKVIYIDHYGNAMTGLRGDGLDRSRVFEVCGVEVRYSEVFAHAPPGQPFWYVNSIGLVELAISQQSIADRLGLSVGQTIHEPG